MVSLSPSCPQEEQLSSYSVPPTLKTPVPLEGLCASSAVLFHGLWHSQGPCPVPKGAVATSESEGAVLVPGAASAVPGAASAGPRSCQCCPAQPLPCHTGARSQLACFNPNPTQPLALSLPRGWGQSQKGERERTHALR